MLRQKKITIFWGELSIHWTGLVLDSPKLLKIPHSGQDRGGD